MSVPKGYQLDTQSSLPQGYTLDQQDFSAGPDNTEGVYKMTDKSGKQFNIPYSNVGPAFQSGYRLIPDEATRYMKDAAADPALKYINSGSNVKVVGRNSAGQPMIAPDDSQNSFGAQVSQVLPAAGKAIAEGVKGMGQFFNPLASDEEKKSGRTTFLENLYPVTLAERLVAPQVQQAQQAVETAQRAASPDAQAGDASLAAGHALASVVPFVGPWAASVGEQVGTSLGQGKYGEALGTFGGNAALYEAPHAVKAVARMVPEAAKNTLRAIAGVDANTVPDMAKRAVDANTAAADKHLVDSADAAHETRGNEIDYERQVNEEAQGLEDEHNKNTEDANAQNDRIRQKAQESHDTKVRGVRDKNLLVNAKHEANKADIEQQNAALDNMLEKRRADAENLQNMTNDYYVKEDLEKAKAKFNENQAWNPWHQAMDEEPVDAGQLQKDLKPILDVSPEARRAIRQLQPDAATEADAATPYVQARTGMMQNLGYKGGPEEYEGLPPEKKQSITDMMKSAGYEPDPISLDPNDIGNTTVPLKVIQRAQSIIGRDIGSGRYQGPLLGEMKQVQKVLRKIVTDKSAAKGTTSLLNDGRKATQDYQEAFGKERHTPSTQDEIRRQTANPEQYAEEDDDARVAAAAKLSPDLADSYKKVKAARDAFKNLPTEDQLRKQRQQVPEPPSVGDIRPGYGLENEPTYQPPSVGDLRPGHALKEPPTPPEGGFEAQARQNVKQPSRDLGPDRPKDIQYANDDIEKEQTKEITKRGESLRQHGFRRAVYAGLTGVALPVVFAFSKEGMSPIRTAAGAVAAGGLVFAASHIAANLLRNPEVAHWIGKISDKDVRQWEKLPADQKAVFTGDMQSLVHEADKQKIPVSPYFRGFISGIAGTQSHQQTLDQLKKEAKQREQQLKQQQQQQLQQQQTVPAPGPQGMNGSYPYTHYYDEKTARVLPVES